MAVKRACRAGVLETACPRQARGLVRDESAYLQDATAGPRQARGLEIGECRRAGTRRQTPPRCSLAGVQAATKP